MGNNAYKCASASLQSEVESEIFRPIQDEFEMFTIVLIGDIGAGKSCLLERFYSNKFVNLEATIGNDFKKKTILLDEKKIQLNILDTPGSERSYQLYRHLYKQADGIVLVYDITKENSLPSLRNRWITEIRENIESQVPIIIVGSKCDLEDKRAVQRSEVEEIWKDISEITYVVESSAKTSENIEFIFTWLVTEINKIKQNQTSSEPTEDTSENQGVTQNSKTFEKLSVTDPLEPLTTSHQSEKSVASHNPTNNSDD